MDGSGRLLPNYQGTE